MKPPEPTCQHPDNPQSPNNFNYQVVHLLKTLEPMSCTNMWQVFDILGQEAISKAVGEGFVLCWQGRSDR